MSQAVEGDIPEQASEAVGLTARHKAQPLQTALSELLAELPQGQLRVLRILANQNGTGVAREAIISGLLPAWRVYQAIAHDTGLPFVHAPLDPERLVLSDEAARIALRQPVPIPYRLDDGRLALAIAPEVYRFEQLTQYLDRHPAVADRIFVTSADNLRDALLSRLSETIADRASSRLMDATPVMSARRGSGYARSLYTGVFTLALLPALLFVPNAALAVSHVLATAFFLSCVLLRLRALSANPLRRESTLDLPRSIDLPVYTVLVACYREAAMAPQIIAAMKALRWPASKLEVKLVCEADDLETIEAFRAQMLPVNFEILPVPVRGPRTKPKALNFALQCSSGRIIAVYDAEDRPHPDQLMEAWVTLESGDENLACVQAPLDIDNGGQSWLARMFELEYAALFRGVLPYLASRGALLPLGGTSNHFDRAVLDQVGAWDPYNVTEDADLSVRLARHGYRCGVITRPTLEAAPARLRDWIPQRTRWFKGWMQTWLVHMRQPRRARAQLGGTDYWLKHILFAGTIGSALVYPLMLTFVVWTVFASAGPVQPGPLNATLAFVDISNVVLAYGVFFALASRVASPRGLFGRLHALLTLPAYWVLHSWAAWRALWQLHRDPYLWEKTDHTPVAPNPPGL